MVLVIRIRIQPWLEAICVCPLLFLRRLWFGYSFRRIALTQNRYAIVDPADYHRLAKHKWRANRSGTTFYAIRGKWLPQLKKQINVRMHRQILNLPNDLLVDHINGNGLDNRRANLRPATCSQNNCNARKHCLSRSRYKGVSWHKVKGKWNARIMFNRRTISLGYFDDERSAAKAYDVAARRHHGRFARPNFTDTFDNRHS